jgi:glycogenin glucosyltransferase
MASPFAFVTLVSSDSYLPGALAQVAAIRDLHPSPKQPDFQTVCLVTPESLNVATIKHLRKEFDLVVGVEILEQENQKALQLLGTSRLHVHICVLFIPL